MKTTLSIPLAVALTCLLGCASAPTTTLLQPIGPAPTARPSAQDTGTLQVHSLRQQAQLDVHLEVYFSGATFLDEMKSLPAHTDYTIYTSDGQCLERVRNARYEQDALPAPVALQPGRYFVQADARGPGASIRSVRVPVVIEAGKTTAVYLDGDWPPAGPHSRTQVVRLPSGQIAGWQAETAAR